MRLAIFLCLPIVIYITLLITSDVLKPTYDLHTVTNSTTIHNTTITTTDSYKFTSDRSKIPSHVAPLAGFVTTLLVALVMAVQTPETRAPEIFFGMLIQAGLFINLFAFPPGASSEFSSLLLSLILLISDVKQQYHS
jgi:hypothetical protein